MAAWLKSQAWNLGAFLWGVAEGTLFFLVPDVILTYVGLRRGYKAAAIASLFAAFGAACGGLILYAWSAQAPEAATAAVMAVPAISDAMNAGAQRDITSLGWFSAALLGPLTSTPYKVYAVLAPRFDVNVFFFAVASVLVRLPRFLVVSLVVTFAGRILSRSLSARTRLLVLTAAWVAFYAAFFALMPI